ncbi:hypothetical protein, partial [Acidiferrobacter sp.]|uniref:hypothetical protein n=1 Tax=Acidiferrobacter sp. TaxID=1872107 RepID=UPI002602D975
FLGWREAASVPRGPAPLRLTAARRQAEDPAKTRSAITEAVRFPMSIRPVPSPVRGVPGWS